MAFDVYKTVTDKILTLMESGQIPWEKPWHCGNMYARNMITKKPYQGVNSFLLGTSEYDSPWWGTYQQISSLRGNVRKGEKGTTAVFYTKASTEKINPKTGEKERHTFPYLKHFTVFNLLQTERLDHNWFKVLEEEIKETEIHPDAEKIGLDMAVPVEIVHKRQDRAFYTPKTDKITLPPVESFKSQEGYYETKFHEMVHATGHDKRLSRASLKEASFFGDTAYSKEELVAEFGSVYLLHECGLARDTTLRNQAAYLQGWLNALKNDKRMLVWAIGKAQQAANYILNRKSEENKGE